MKVWAYLAIIAVLLGAAAGIFHAGKVSERVAHLKAIGELRAELDADRIEYEAATNSMAIALLTKQVERVTVYETITDEIIKYVNNSPTCDINYGAYGLLYAASTDGEQGHYASLTDAEKASPALTSTDAFAVTINWAKAYYETVDQLHLLQDRVNELRCVNKVTLQ